MHIFTWFSSHFLYFFWFNLNHFCSNYLSIHSTHCFWSDYCFVWFFHQYPNTILPFIFLFFCFLWFGLNLIGFWQIFSISIICLSLVMYFVHVKIVEKWKIAYNRKFSTTSKNFFLSYCKFEITTIIGRMSSRKSSGGGIAFTSHAFCISEWIHFISLFSLINADFSWDVRLHSYFCLLSAGYAHTSTCQRVMICVISLHREDNGAATMSIRKRHPSRNCWKFESTDICSSYWTCCKVSIFWACTAYKMKR